MMSSQKMSAQQVWLCTPLGRFSVSPPDYYAIEHQRIYVCIGGPAIGPVAGGFIAQNLGIKWVFIVIASMSCLLFTHTLNSYILSAKVLCAVAAVVGIPFLRETYGPVVLRRKALRVLSSGDAEAAITAEKILASDPLRGTGSKLNKIWVNISRPAVLLTRSFICFILSLYMA